MGRSTMIALFLLAGGAASASAQALSRTVVVDGLKSPWSIAFLSATEALITEKEGGVLRADLTTGRTAPIAGVPEDLVDDIRAEARFDNGGLFDIVLDPAFAENSWVYLAYAAKSEAGGRTTKVIRARLAGEALEDHETLLEATPYTDEEYFHYGGGLTFGADGKLYVTVGERIFNETSNPALPIAQDPLDRRGKIYRLNPDGSAPADNPDFGPDAPLGLYATGVRAPQGVTLHPETGEIWFSEHGSRQGDEINRLEAGANYGWPIVTTGGYRNEDYQPPERLGQTFVEPVWSWAQTVAPTGLVFYDGPEFPQWRGDLFVAGLARGSLWRLNFEAGSIVSVEELFVHDRVRSRKVALSPDGGLYMLTDTLLRTGADGGLEYTGEPGGQLLRLAPGAADRAFQDERSR